MRHGRKEKCTAGGIGVTDERGGYLPVQTGSETAKTEPAHRIYAPGNDGGLFPGKFISAGYDV